MSAVNTKKIDFFGCNIMAMVYGKFLHFATHKLFYNFVHFNYFHIDFWPVPKRCIMPISSGQQTRPDQPNVRLRCMVSVQGALCRMDKELEVISLVV